MPFKYGKINKDTPMIVIDIKMQSAQVGDQSRLLVNNYLAVGKKIQLMKNKIERLNKKIK